MGYYFKKNTETGAIILAVTDGVVHADNIYSKY
jgi:hypothetical protein